MKTYGKILNSLAGVVLLLSSGQAGAIMLDTTYTGTDKGVDYTLEVSDSGGGLYDIWYTLDTTDFVSNAGGGTNAKSLHAVSVKAFSSVSSIGDFTVLLDGSTDVTTDWMSAFGQINGNTTQPDGDVVGPGSGWLSAYFLGLTGLDVPDGTISFHWEDIVGAPLTDDDPSAKAVYVFRENPNGAKDIGDFADQTSIHLNGPDVPEPTPLVLLAMGLAVIGLGRKLAVLRKT